MADEKIANAEMAKKAKDEQNSTISELREQLKSLAEEKMEMSKALE